MQPLEGQQEGGAEGVMETVGVTQEGVCNDEAEALNKESIWDTLLVTKSLKIAPLKLRKIKDLQITVNSKTDKKSSNILGSCSHSYT